MQWRRTSSIGLVLWVVGCGEQPASTVTAPAVASSPVSAESAHEEYLRLHLALLSPSQPDWSAAVERLRAVGDGFTLVQLDALAPQLDAEQERLADGLRAAVRARVADDSAATLPALLLARLERAALADIQCHPLEGNLGSWAFASIRAHVDDARVRAELERIRDHYEPSVEVRTVFATLSGRVVRYATELLAEDDPVAAQQR